MMTMQTTELIGGGDAELKGLLCLLLDILTPHSSTPGADVLLRLALRLLLAGGVATLSYSDLTGLLSCNRASVAEARRLGERLRLLRCEQGQRIDGRRGPAPLTWHLLLAAIGANAEPIPPVGARSQPGTSEAGELMRRQTSPRSEPVAADPDPSSQKTDRDRTDPDALAPLIAGAAQRLGEAWPAKMDQALRPLLAPLLADAWSPAEVAHLLDGCIAACLATARKHGQPPRHPASYLRVVVAQRLGHRLHASSAGGPGEPDSGGPLPAPTERFPEEAPAMEGAAEAASAVMNQPPLLLAGPPLPLPMGLTPAQFAATLREDLVRASPQLARTLQSGWFSVAPQADSLLLLVSTEYECRQLMTPASQRHIERAVAALMGRPVPIRCATMTAAGRALAEPLAALEGIDHGRPRLAG